MNTIIYQQQHPDFLDKVVLKFIETLKPFSSGYLLKLLTNIKAVLAADGVCNENLLSADFGFCKGLNNSFRIRYINFNFVDKDVLQTIPFNFRIDVGNYLSVEYDEFLSKQINAWYLSQIDGNVTNSSFDCFEIRLNNIVGDKSTVKMVSYVPTSAEAEKLLVSANLKLMNFCFMRAGSNLSEFDYTFYSDSHFETCQRLLQWVESFGMGDNDSGVVKKALFCLKEKVQSLCQNKQSSLRTEGVFQCEEDLFLLNVKTM